MRNLRTSTTIAFLSLPMLVLGQEYEGELGIVGDPVPIDVACTLESLRELPDVRITSVTEESQFAPHCKVAGVIGTETNFELLLPNDWNGKFVMGGGGGFAGSVVNGAQDFWGALQMGYATVGTDTGHQAQSQDASWALNNLERLVSFGHQAVHRTAVTAKALTEDYYSQALMEAQRYPEDF